VGLVVAAASTHRLIVIFPLLQGNNCQKIAMPQKKQWGKKSVRPQHFSLRNNPQKQQLLHQHIG